MKLKKIYCYMLLLILVINSPISAYAQSSATTPTVTIAAGTGAAVGGAYQGYTTKTAAAATALTLAVLSATGAAVKLTEASVQAGKTVYQVINDKFAQWVGGTSAEELTTSQAEELQSRFKVITGGGGNLDDPNDNQDNGTNISEDGKLWFSPGSLAMLEKFTSFLESQDDGVLTYEEPTVQTDIVNLGNYQTVMSNSTYLKLSPTSGNLNVINTNKPCAVFIGRVSNGKYCRNVMICNEIFTYRGAQSGTATKYKGYYYVDLTTMSCSLYYPEGAAVINADYNANYIIDRITKWEVQTPTATIEQDGIYANENWNNGLLRNPNNQILVVDPGILNGFNVDSDRQIAIPDYIDLIIQQAEERAKREAQPDQSPAPQELPVPLLDPIAGTKSPANWVDPAPEDAIQDPIESEKRDPDPDDPKDPVIDDETPTDPEDAVELMKVDLTRIFPFCIPWDLYRLFTKFNADPVTPSITIDWGDILGTFGIDYVTTLDLHDYDNVASILRTMETVAFVVGLAVATRSIFLRS